MHNYLRPRSRCNFPGARDFCTPVQDNDKFYKHHYVTKPFWRHLKILYFYGNRRVVAVFSRTQHILSHINPVHILNIISLKPILMLSAHLHLGSQMSSSIRIFSSLTRATRPAHFSLLGLIKYFKESV